MTSTVIERCFTKDSPPCIPQHITKKSISDDHWTWIENLPGAHKFQCGLRQEDRNIWFFLECVADV